MMNQPILDIAASAAAVLLFLFAARSFVVGSNHEPLGWGFGLASGGILAYLVKDHVGGFGNGLRLGLGILLALPALRAIVDPKSTSILTAVFSLLIAFAVAGNPAKKLIQAYGPETATSDLVRTQNELGKLEKQRDRAREILDELSLQKDEIKRELKSLDLSNDDLAKHPRMQLLASTVEAKDKWESALVVIEKEVQARTIRIQALEAGIEMDRMGQENPELADILREMESGPVDLKNMDLLQRTVHQDRMRKIIEKEME